MSENTLDRLGRRYIGDPKDVGLPDTAYSSSLEFEPEELTQRALKKRYLISATLGEKYDLVATAVQRQVKMLINFIGFALAILSILMVVTHIGDFTGTAMQAASGVAARAAAPSQTPEEYQAEMVRKITGR